VKVKVEMKLQTKVETVVETKVERTVETKVEKTRKTTRLVVVPVLELQVDLVGREVSEGVLRA
jgi:hypothetical protein